MSNPYETKENVGAVEESLTVEDAGRFGVDIDPNDLQQE